MIALTSDEVAAILHCEAQTVREQARLGELPGVKFGRDWIFPVDALQESLNRIAREQADSRRKKPEPVAVFHANTKRSLPRLPSLADPHTRS